jgi:hypothetical protein
MSMDIEPAPIPAECPICGHAFTVEHKAPPPDGNTNHPASEEVEESFHAAIAAQQEE